MTDGAMSPTEAISHGASILVEQLTPFTGYARVPEVEVGKGFVREEHNTPVEDLGLSVRTIGCLRRAGIATVGEIISRGEKELLSLRNFGQKSKQELEDRLKTMGLSLTPEE